MGDVSVARNAGRQADALRNDARILEAAKVAASRGATNPEGNRD